ncbi:MAG TPA: hypothetical protein VNI20_05245 [Fimbriimonadaceae bacterium]|nr:hypothetical protein [Fimbriimonadaceae bacterium]
MDPLPIIHVCLERGSHACKRHVAPYWRRIQRRTTVQTIETLHDRASWPSALYLMTGLDGMDVTQLALVGALWDELQKRPNQCRALNDPRRVKDRYSLLTELRQKGMNDFGVFRLDEIPCDLRYPVFVRYERLHRANLTPLLHSRAQLDDALAALIDRGECPCELLVVEWLDYKDDDGYYRKWGAHKTGPFVFGKHLMAGSHWMVKRKTTERRAVGSDELPYVADFPHHDLLAPVFEMSGHDWARIDYSFCRGRLQVWEINDNPELGTKWKRDFGRRKVQQRVFANFERAFAHVTEGVQLGVPMQFSLGRKGASQVAEGN